MDKWLQSNTVAKIVALLLALMLWLFAASEQTTGQPTLTEHEFKDISITWVTDETQFATINATENADIVLRGSPNDIRSVAVGSLRVIADATDRGHGEHDDVVLRVEGVPRGVQAYPRPEIAAITLERKATIELPVRILLYGEAAPGFTAGQPIVSPNRVFVTGTEAELAKIEILSAQINISNASSVIDETVRIRALDKESNELNVEINPTVVDVIVPVSSPFKELPLSIHFEGHPTEGYSVGELDLSSEYITVFGPVQEIERYEFFPGPTFNIEGISETTIYEQSLNSLFGTTQIEPSKIEVTVNIVESEVMELLGVPIEINGLADNIKATLEQNSIKLKLEASPDRLQLLAKEDIQVFVDVSNKALGEHDIILKVSTPRFVKVFDLEQESVTVLLERRNN